MKLTITGIAETLNFDDYSIYTICIENKMLYTDIVTRLYSNLTGGSDDVFLYNGDKKLDFTKNIEIVDNVFNLDFTGMKLTNALYNNLKNNIQLSPLYSDYQKLVRSLTEFYDKVKASSDFNVDWEDIDIIPVLKVGTFKFVVNESDNMLKRLLDYMHVYREALGVKLFVFLNNKFIFKEEDIGKLYQQCALEGCNILNIDCISSCKVAEEEKIIIIDNDLCEIT